jgi:predicted ATPase/class 3 adenylate cyclase/Tfp pilus assembly protein PilF
MSEVLALLQTDVVGSTALSGRLGDAATAALWSEHDRAARDLLRSCRGREIDKSDGFLLLFASAADALEYALGYQRALAGLSVPLLARAGLHVGPVTTRANSHEDIAHGAKPLEVDGLAKPTTARVMALAQAGQTLLTADAKAALGATARRLQAHGHWRLKGLEQPIELFEASADDHFHPPPPDTDKAYRVVRRQDLWLTLAEVRHSLPAERDPFIGREAALRELARRFEAGARMISLLGIGGTGKTRLAQRYGWSWLGDFPGGVWFCDLSQARNLDGIVHAVAHGLDVPLGRDDPVAQLGAAIDRRGPCLLILDNFEQVAALAPATVGVWLDRAAQARFILTTREVLGLPGEEAMAVAPLEPLDAATLFRQRAAAARSDFRPSADDERAIDPLVRLLDGLPLAIELAAARVRIMPPRTLLARMRERFELLTSRGGRLSRQATLRGAFDWSWDLLTTPEKAALAQLSVFEGGLTLEAAESVVDVSDQEAAPAALELLQSLVDKSFVRHVSDQRFDLLWSVKEYAAEHLRSAGRYPGSGADAVRTAEQRHSRHFAQLGEKRAILDACVELDNLIAACRRAAAVGDAETAIGALEGAWAALRLRGPFRVGIELAQTVVSSVTLAPRTASRVERVAARRCRPAAASAKRASGFQAAVARGPRGRRSRMRRPALHGLGWTYAQDGQVDEARVQLEAALKVARALGDRGLQCDVLNELGHLHGYLGALDEARGHYESALAIAQAAGDRRWEGGSLGNLGQLLANQGRLPQAKGYYERAVLIARELGDRNWEGNALCNLGLLHHAERQMDDARNALEAALAIARDLGHARLEGIVLCNLGIVCASLGDPATARTRYEAALEVARSLGDRRSEGQFITYLGLLHAREHRPADATACLDTGEVLLRALQDRISLGILLCSRAEAEHLAGRHDAAHAALREAEALAQAADPGADSEFGQSLDGTRALLGAT